MKIMKQTSILFIFALTLAAIPFLSTEAQAFESIYNSSCGSCHSGASQPSCIGCHSLSNFRGQTNKTSYQPGEAMTVNVTGSGRTSTSWVRVLIYDQNGNEVVRTSGSNSGMGSASTLPVALSATAPTAPGTYTWEAAWFSNDSGSMGTHGEMGRVNTNSFTVMAPAPVDSDGDGSPDNTDCAPNDPNIYPGANEIPYNGIDENCNGMADDVIDADADGFNSNVDCNDSNAAINPGASEIPYNGIDENCNGMSDDVIDADADGFNSNVDCNDNNPAINPGAADICGQVDQNCDNVIDACPVVDNDGDGYPATEDCNDNNPAINPGAADICGQVDQNCDNVIDACPVVDNDGDGYPATEDCNDNNPAINPGAADICGQVDQNCDNVIDACPVIDTDGDGVADIDDNCPDTPAGTQVDANGCAAVVEPTVTDVDEDGYDAVSYGGNDCNDDVAAINPGAAEHCEDNIDNNCDGLTDGQDTIACPAPLPTCTDGDVDGFYAQTDCNTVQDCNDNDGQTFPGATELCGDAIDNDCDGNVDENCDIIDINDGAELYQNKCTSCHGELPRTNVCGEDVGDIMEAIAENEGGMSKLSHLTDAQVKLIAETLSNCNKDEDDDRDYDRNYDRSHDERESDSGKRRSRRSHYDD